MTTDEEQQGVGRGEGALLLRCQQSEQESLAWPPVTVWASLGTLPHSAEPFLPPLPTSLLSTQLLLVPTSL